ncbi:hypothetical protein [Paenibacillus sp. NPDC057934]|uniref:hypothetical protein n=1 Tax=Paenibacillus sp. NPDC057934 TaxID=3346282 RepID=UPI0036DC88A6
MFYRREFNHSRLFVAPPHEKAVNHVFEVASRSVEGGIILEKRSVRLYPRISTTIGGYSNQEIRGKQRSEE